MSARRTVAIAGASGNLGGKLTQGILLPKFRERFSEVIVLSRSRSQKIEELGSQGATIRLYSQDNLKEALSGVDVLINAVGAAGHKFKEELLHCLPETSVSLYFPSEFGLNHYLCDLEHEEWDTKKRHFSLAKQLLTDTRICRVYAGLFLEDSVGPWFGFLTSKDKYEAVGSPDQQASYTSMLDVGKAVAVLASGPPDLVPPEVYLCGDSKSMSEIASIMQDNGSDRIEVSSIPLEDYKAKVMAKPSPTPERYLRFLMGEGKLDHSAQGTGNQNHLIEGVGKIETWKSMVDLARENHGRPWVEAEWELVSE